MELKKFELSGDRKYYVSLLLKENENSGSIRVIYEGVNRECKISYELQRGLIHFQIEFLPVSNQEENRKTWEPLVIYCFYTNAHSSITGNMMLKDSIWKASFHVLPNGGSTKLNLKVHFH